MNNLPVLTRRILTATVIITSLGNFIDMFDLLLFSMLRVKSLGSFGLQGTALTDAGLTIANCQWAGLLLGSYLWGVIGDRQGRKAALLISILIYSLGSIASGLAGDVHIYMLARFITGLGIAGELGGGLTLISERLDAERRGTGLAVFIAVGFLGVVCAALAAQTLPWQVAYIGGGIAGLVMLLLRTALPESDMFTASSAAGGRRGGLGLVLKRPRLFKQYIGSIFLMMTGTFLPQIVWTLSPEIAAAKGLIVPVGAPYVLAIGFGLSAVMDMAAMRLSRYLRSRKRAGLICQSCGLLCFLLYLWWPVHSVSDFYLSNAVAATGMSAWIFGCTWMAESFGVDIRATITTTAPSFARAMVIIMNIAYGHLKIYGVVHAVGAIGITVYALAFLGWTMLPETWGRDLNYLERDASGPSLK